MEKIRKCVRCRYENPMHQIYCLKCGKFLKKNNENTINNVTIWSLTDNQPTEKNSATKTQEASVGKIKDFKVVVCPKCNQIQKTVGDILPLNCEECGYFFQMGVDQIVNISEVQDSNLEDNSGIIHTANESNIADNPVTVQMPRKSARKEDRTNMRLIVRSENAILPQKINPLGEIIGKNGTIFRELNIDAQIKINRAATGWYIEVLSGDCVVNGIHINEQVQRKLVNGDYLYIDKYHIFVEITE